MALNADELAEQARRAKQLSDMLSDGDEPVTATNMWYQTKNSSSGVKGVAVKPKTLAERVAAAEAARGQNNA